MLRIVADNCVRITGASPESTAELQQYYTVANPDYYKLERMGKWTGGTPQTLAIWQRDGETLILPSGTLAHVLEVFKARGEHGKLRKAFCAAESVFLKSNISLYPYQESAVEAAQRAERGIVIAPCGSGKTQMGLELVSRLGLKTLWLTHTHELLNQSMSRAIDCFDADEKAFGTITAGKVDIGTGITFATVQTMARLNLEDFRDTFGCVVVDECHHVAGSPTKLMQFGKVVNALNARYKYGLTATLKRADGLVKCTKAYIGDVVYEVSKEAVAEKTCPVRYQFVDTGWDCDPDDVVNSDGTLNYVQLINAVCSDKERDAKIEQELTKRLQAGIRMLVLTDRVAHVRALWHRLSERCKAFAITGAGKKEERKTAIEAFRKEDCAVMVATYQLAKEGLDIPELTHLVLASPNKTDTVIIQAAGRVARACEGKAFGTIIDFMDEFSPLQNWAKKRQRIYRKLDYEPLS